MAEKDITKTGALTAKQLQQLNNDPFALIRPSIVSSYDINRNAPQEVRSSLLDNETSTGKKDYWGRSHFDNKTATAQQFRNLGDIRAENQPWYSKIVNGVGKGGVLAVTTAAETLGLVYGIGQGIADAHNTEKGEGRRFIAFLHGVWDNPVTEALQNINQASEDIMPNYYTQDEIENPFSNIFTANFLGDKLIKNFGFMVGAFYGGAGVAKGIGKAGQTMARTATKLHRAERIGMARKVGQLTAEYGNDAKKLEDALKAAKLTDADRAKKVKEGLERIDKIAQKTRTTTQTVGVIGSAINEGAIEAINNSEDWAREQRAEAADLYQRLLYEAQEKYGDTPEGHQAMAEAYKVYQYNLAEIERGKARMGNADLLLNLPILIASNAYELGRLYSRGFNSTRRQMGTIWNGYRLPGKLGDIHSDRNWRKGLASALYKTNTEGLEEFLQRAASDGAGNAVSDSIMRGIEAGYSENAKNSAADYILGFGKATAQNLSDPNAWEEYMIGALSAAIGMPSFGRANTKNADVGKGKIIGLSGGLYGNYREYMDQKRKEDGIANYLNGRVKDPNFKKMYEVLRQHDDYDRWIEEELAKGDKSKYKDLHFEDFYKALDAAASTGHLGEFKEFINFNKDYNEEELHEIAKNTSVLKTAKQQKDEDLENKKYLETTIKQIEDERDKKHVVPPKEYELYKKALEEIDNRLKEDKYEDSLSGPFVEANKFLSESDPEKMKGILERNRKKILDDIDDYLKIRNEIDIETDGQLDNTQIGLLTMLKGHILDYEKRSEEIADDFISSVGDISSYVEGWKNKGEERLAEAKADYAAAKKEYDEVKKGSDKKAIQNAETQLSVADRILTDAQQNVRQIGKAITLLDLLTAEKETTGGERAAMAKGYGYGLLGRLANRLSIGGTRAINSEEAMNILANHQNPNEISPNVIALAGMIRMSDLSDSDKLRLEEEVIDLGRMGNKKVEYNRKVREYLKDISLLEEDYKNKKKELEQKNIDSQAEELASALKESKDMVELDSTLKSAYAANSEVASSALTKAKQTNDESVKNFIADYESGRQAVRNFEGQLDSIDDSIKSIIVSKSRDAWESALTRGVDTENNYLQYLQDYATEMATEPNPVLKRAADVINGILKSLGKSKSNTATRATVNKKPSLAEAIEIIPAKGKEKEEGSPKTENLEEKPEEAKPDTPDSLLEDVRKEVLASISDRDEFDVDEFKALSEALQNRIEKYNQEHPDDQFKIDWSQLLQSVYNEYITSQEEDIADDDTEQATDNDYEERSNEMKRNIRVKFKSDYPSKFVIGSSHKSKYKAEASNLMTQERADQLNAVLELLDSYKAYDFLDRNYLGYIFTAFQAKHKKVPIHFIKSTSEDVNKDASNPITFLALEWSPEIEEAIKSRLGKNVDDEVFQSNIKLITIGDSKYQLLGVLNTQIDSPKLIQETCIDLQNQLSMDMENDLEIAKSEGNPFVVHPTLSTYIDTVYTGRLDRTDAETNTNPKQNLYDYMNSTSEEYSRKPSQEFTSGQIFYFGVVVNGDMKASSSDDLVEVQQNPNQRWMDNHNGNVVLFAPKPDGQLYPISCTRKTVDVWFNTKADGQHTGEELYKAVLNKEVRNEYIENILNYLRTLLNPDASVRSRIKAKQMLSKYFIFKGEGKKKSDPFYFEDSKVVMTIDKEQVQIDSDDFNESVDKFFNALKDHQVKFTLPAPSIESVNGRDVISSGIMEVGLRGFYNYNSNFTIEPIDATGKKLTNVEAPSITSYVGKQYGGDYQFDLGEGLKTYHKDEEGKFFLDGKPVSPETQSLLNVILDVQSGKVPSFKKFMLDGTVRNGSRKQETADYLNDKMPGFESIYAIEAEDGEVWIYDSTITNPYERLYKLSDKKGEDLIHAFNEAINNFSSNPDNWSKIKSLNTGKKEESPVEASEPKPEEKPKKGKTKSSKGSKNTGGTSVKKYLGKKIEELSTKDGGLSAYLVAHRKDPIIKGQHKGSDNDFDGLYDMLQQAEELRYPINEKAILAILEGSAKPKIKLGLLRDEINECHK